MGSGVTTLRRHYHSNDHPSGPGPFNDAERNLLSAAYRHVPELGFTQEALAKGFEERGYLGISSAAMLQDGAFSLIRWHLATQRECLKVKVEEVFGNSSTGNEKSGPLSSTEVAERVERLTWERLMGNREVIHKWQEVWFNPPPLSPTPAPQRPID